MSEPTSPLITRPPPECPICRETWDAGANYGSLFCSECRPESFTAADLEREDPRIVVFAQRTLEDGNGEYVFDITTTADRTQFTDELSKRGYEVYSGPARSDLPPEDEEVE